MDQRRNSRRGGWATFFVVFTWFAALPERVVRIAGPPWCDTGCKGELRALASGLFGGVDGNVGTGIASPMSENSALPSDGELTPEDAKPQASDQDTAAAAASSETAAVESKPDPDGDTAEPRKIQVGSRRPEDGEKLVSSKPVMPHMPQHDAAAAAMDAAATTGGGQVKVAKPSRRDALTPELEQEIEAALMGASLDELVGGTFSPEAGEPLDSEERYRATVVKIHGDNVFFGLRGRDEGVASLRQFKDPPEVGAAMDVIVTGRNADDGLYELRVPGASVAVQDWSDLSEGAVVDAKVTKSNTGGLECTVGSIRGFIPASQVEMFRVEDFSDYVDQKLLCVVTEVNPHRGNLVLSHRALLEREKEEKRQEMLEELEPGTVLDGTVSKLMDFGAFVDLGGLDGLVHISQLSWDRVEHPSEVLEVGQKIQVKVEKIDKQTGRIGLSYRELLEDPWSKVDADFPVDSTVKGTVTRLAQFGAFVKIGPGIEGLVHISELAHHRVIQVRNVVKEGDEVEVKVLSLDPQAQRISLSLKAALPVPESTTKKAGAEEPDQDETPRKLQVPPRQGELKGGTGRPSGGDQFGLNW